MNKKILNIIALLFFCIMFSCSNNSILEGNDDDSAYGNGTNGTVLSLNIKEPGTLPSMISNSDMYKISKLKLSGQLNGTDVWFIRKMAGANEYDGLTDGVLAYLDLTNVEFVSGGRKYRLISDSDGENITVPKKISCNMFRSCRSIVQIKIPQNIEEIDRNAFNYCQGMTTIEIPKTVKRIGDKAFFQCNSLCLTIPNTVESIGQYVFTDGVELIIKDGDNKISIGSGISATTIYIGRNYDKWFINRSEDVTFGNSINSPIYFSGTNVQKVKLPETLESLDDYCFDGCSSLQSIELPQGITKIGNCCFRNCSSLTSFYIPSSVVWLGWNMWEGCDNLTKIIVNNENPPASYLTADKTLKSHCTLYVPKGCIEKYSVEYAYGYGGNSWAGFSSYQEIE